jgi:hypothetical protein
MVHNPNLSVQQVKNLLLTGGDVVLSLIDKTLTGRRLNIGNSFQALAENDSCRPALQQLSYQFSKWPDLQSRLDHFR